MLYVTHQSSAQPVKPAIAQCNTAGIKVVVMVTGYHPITAHAIVKSLNIITKLTVTELQFDKLCLSRGPLRGDRGARYRDADLQRGGLDPRAQTQGDHVRGTMFQQKQGIVRELNQLGHAVATE
jgi:magnesium-transporting ATPase (P-type)